MPVVVGSAKPEESSQDNQELHPHRQRPREDKREETEQGESGEQKAAEKAVNPVGASSPHSSLASQGRAARWSTWRVLLQCSYTQLWPDSGLGERRAEARLGAGLAGRVPHMAYFCSGRAFHWRPAAEVDWGPSLTRISVYIHGGRAHARG